MEEGDLSSLLDGPHAESKEELSGSKDDKIGERQPQTNRQFIHGKDSVRST
jgi:hypothetical protein